MVRFMLLKKTFTLPIPKKSNNQSKQERGFKDWHMSNYTALHVDHLLKARNVLPEAILLVESLGAK